MAVGECFVNWVRCVAQLLSYHVYHHGLIQEVKLQKLYVTYCKNYPRSDAVVHDPSKSFFDVRGHGSLFSSSVC